MPTLEKTHEYRDRLRWNNTELITPSDLNAAQASTRRYVTDLLGDLGATEWAQGSLSAPVVRPLGDALRVLTTGADMQVAVEAGGFLFAPAMDPGQPDQYTLYHRLEDLIVLGEASPGHPLQPRHDLVTIKVEDGITSLEDEETRVFRDAVNGKRSSQEFVKRTRTRATLRYHEGSPFLPTAGLIPGDPLIPDDEVPIARLVVPPGTTSFPVDHATPLIAPFNPNPTGVHGEIRQFIGAGYARENYSSGDTSTFEQGIQADRASYYLPVQAGHRLKALSVWVQGTTADQFAAQVRRYRAPTFPAELVGESTIFLGGGAAPIKVDLTGFTTSYVEPDEIWLASIVRTVVNIGAKPKFYGFEIVFDRPR